MAKPSYIDPPAGGLPLNEAWEQWRDPGLLAKYRETARKIPRQWSITDTGVFRLRRVAAQEWRAVINSFKKSLLDGKLIALGREGSFDAPMKAISREAWQGAKSIWKSGRVTTADGKTYYSVHVYEPAVLEDLTRPDERLVMALDEVRLSDVMQAKRSMAGTAIVGAALVHASPTAIAAYTAARGTWEKAGKPTRIRIDKFKIHSSIAQNSFLPDNRPYVEKDDDTWTALGLAEKALVASFWRRVAVGDCLLVGFREDIEQQAVVPREILDTLTIDYARQLATTPGKTVYHRLVVFERDDYAALPAPQQSPSAKTEDSRTNKRALPLNKRVWAMVREMADAGELEGCTQASITETIRQRLGESRARRLTIKGYVHVVWKAELERSRKKPKAPR